MRLKKLTLTNFQGFRSFTLDTEGGRDVSVFADNARGKTTLYNAFLWLFFEKNSLGAKDFDIKTRDETGFVIPSVSHEVEAVIEIDGTDQTLKRLFLEKYTRKRGSAEAEFTGHVTEHYIDGVPKSKGEYQAFIDSIAPEKLFMTLTSPTYFNEQLTWQERRAMLMDMCPAVSDHDIFNEMGNRDDILLLESILNTRSVDDAKKVETATRKKINEELSTMPGRIDEATRAIPEDATGNLEALAAKAQKVAGELAPLREEKIRLLSGGQVAAKQNELAEIDLAITQLRGRHAASVPDVSVERKQQHDIANKVQLLELQVDADKREVVRLEAAIESHKGKSREIFQRWTEQNTSRFTPGGACPTCGQGYPENLQAVQEADFNRARATALEAITADGKANETAWKEVSAKLAAKQAAITANQDAIEALRTDASALQGIIDKKCTLPDVKELPEYIELAAQWDAINNEIVKLKADSGLSCSDIDQRITAKQAELDAINRQITAIESAAIQRKRIEELKAREKELARQFEQSEKVLYLIEQFIRAKVSRLEESINSRFEMVRFKLFDTAINGGISETCVCTVNGVPYPSVNNGARIQGGMSIIKALSAHHGFAPCAWVDNKESVTTLPAMDCQVISLVVSEADKQLRVELQQTKPKISREKNHV